ncbi:MAG: DSD1 family PLP-dependent enzyme [bacterium]|nr:DSD1 family PLP-dependent enzyme [Gammaproteobacteria bacterium]HIL97156.1 DSD1 family PLP-dependent enzyme [Pseudomonadales bacterium]
MPTLNQFINETVSKLSFEPIRLDQPVTVEQLPTPALIIDLDVFELNLQKMQQHLANNGMGLRSHTKMHKSPIVAKKQISEGAVGVCCATVSEAEVMLAGGIEQILITSPVVTIEKIERVIALANRSSGVEVVVDYIEGATAFNRLASQAGIVMPVLIDLDPGMGRTGVTPGEKALVLVRHILDECPNLKFGGLQMYIGNCMHTNGFEKRRDKYTHLLQKGIDTKRLFEAEGIEVPVFTGGGTGTFNIDSAIGEITDLQAGSYVFMDVEYRDIGGIDSEHFVDFEPSLFVLATAISKPQDQLITFDAGIKSLATDTAYPEFRDVEGVVYHFGGDEHGIIQLNNPSIEINLGDKLRVITPHCDPTVNLYDYYYPYRDGVVEEIWPISARGRSQ